MTSELATDVTVVVSDVKFQLHKVMSTQKESLVNKEKQFFSCTAGCSVLFVSLPVSM